MNIETKINAEETKEINIHLYKEGLFWRAYNRSAFIVFHSIRDFKPVKLFIKKISKEVVYVGFPDSILQAVLDKAIKVGICREIDESSEKQIRIKIKDTSLYDKQAYEAWHSSVPIKKSKQKEDNLPKNPYASLLVEKIISFPLESKTPLECMAFIAALKSIAMQSSLQ